MAAVWAGRTPVPGGQLAGDAKLAGALQGDRERLVHLAQGAAHGFRVGHDAAQVLGVEGFTGAGTRANFTGTAYLLNTFTPTKTLAVQLSGNYRAPLVVPQGRLLAVYGVEVALRQRLFRDRAALTLRVSDVFNTRRQYAQLAADGLAADLQTTYETRVGYLGRSWFLGTHKPASTIENQPQGDTGGLGG